MFTLRRNMHRFLRRCPPAGLSIRRLPSLGRVPAAPVPRRHQYYEGATTPCTTSLRLIDSPAGTTPRLLVRSRSPAGRGGPGSVGLAAIRLPAVLRGQRRASQVPRRAFPRLCGRSQTPAGPSRLARGGASGAAPAVCKTRAPTLTISRLDSVASPPAVYASRRALPRAMQHSLPAGGLRLCRAGVEPAGSRCKVSTHRVLLARAWPGASILRLALCLGFGGHGLAVAAQWRPPRSRFEASVRTWVLGRRGAGRATPFRHGSCCLRLEGRSRHSECFLFRRSLALPAHAATDASPVPSRERPHGSRKNVYRCRVGGVVACCRPDYLGRRFSNCFCGREGGFFGLFATAERKWGLRSAAVLQ